MKPLDILSLSTRMFRTRPMRTFLTILGLSVGTGAVLFLVSLGYGLQKVVLDKITTADSLLSLDVTPGAEKSISITQANVDEISHIPHVEFVSPIVSLTSQMTVNDFTGSTVANVVDYKYFRLSGLSVDNGKIPASGDSSGIVISSAGAALYGLSPKDIIGKEAKISLFVPKNSQADSTVTTATSGSASADDLLVSDRPEKYTIVGVVSDDSSNYIFFPADNVKDLQLNKFDQLKIKVSDSKYVDDVRNQIIDKGFLVSSLSDVIDQTNKIFKVVQLVLAIFGFIALFVSSIGMINTMTITLLERINEIGIMRAIGITKRDIKIIFLAESLIMGFLGGIGGVAIGFLTGSIMNMGVNLLAKNFGGQALNLFAYPSWFIYFIIIFSTLIGLLTGIFPSIKASNLNPLVALRYK